MSDTEIRAVQDPSIAADVAQGAAYADITSSRRPVVAPQWQRGNIAGTLRQHAGLRSHQAKYHTARTHVYAGRSVMFALIGAGRLTWRLVTWSSAANLRLLESQAVAAGRPGHQHAMSAHTEGERTRARRSRIILIAAVLLTAGVLAMWEYAPRWALAVPALILFVTLVHHGKPAGQPLVASALVPPQFEPLTHAVINRALGSLNIGAINAAITAGPGIAYINDPYRDGEGQACDLDLPHGVTAGAIIKNRDRLASGLRRPLSATWPSGVPHEHEGRLHLWVGFRDLSKVPPAAWPLAKTGTADIFQPVPFATSPDGRGVTVPVFEANWLVGAGPGEGKTSAVRVFACAAALDPVCDLWVHEQAGKGDLEAFAQVSQRYCSGLDDESVRYAAESLAKLRQELEARSDLFKKIPITDRPDGKLTRALARDRRLRPIVAIFDEFQNVCQHPDFGKGAADDAAYVIRLGRAYGIILILATQRPDKESLPTSVTGVVTSRFCLKVPDQVGNDMILGTGAYKAGFNAVAFRHEIDAGLGWLRGSGEPQAVRTYYIDLKGARRITDRARQLRAAAGILSGYALGEGSELEVRDVLADVVQVFTGTGMHWAALAARLAQVFPDRWAGATADSVSADVRARGVRSVAVTVQRETQRGCRLDDVRKVAGG